MRTVHLVVVLALALGVMTSETWAQDAAPAPAPAERQIQVTILGMSCPFCAYGVEQKLKKLKGVKELEVVLETGLATLTLEEGVDVSNEMLRKTVKEAGFEVAKIVRNFESEYPEFSSKRG